MECTVFHPPFDDLDTLEVLTRSVLGARIREGQGYKHRPSELRRTPIGRKIGPHRHSEAIGPFQPIHRVAKILRIVPAPKETRLDPRAFEDGQSPDSEAATGEVKTCEEILAGFYTRASLLKK